jgi:hypothetical protein
VADKTLTQLREELLAGPGVREAYEDQAPEYGSRARSSPPGRMPA